MGKGEVTLYVDDFVGYFLTTFTQHKGIPRYHRETYYFWTGTEYKVISDNEFKVYVGKSIAGLIGSYDIKPKVKMKFETLLKRIQQDIHIPEEVEYETDLTNNEAMGPIAAFKNGVLSFVKENGVYGYKFLKHSPDFFTTRSIPHSLGKTSTAPAFQEFLKQILPDEMDQKLVQEIFGYTLFPLNLFQKAFIFVGEGANGKSTLLNVLRLILGRRNVSSLGIDGIDPSRTFPLATLVSRFANISEDMNEVGKVAEGFLKQIISGETLVLERKHKDPFEWTANTKLIYSTNTLPRFSDKSDGIFRRLVVLPFTQKFLDEGKQRKELSTAEFWVESGELPAITRWAFEGLQRLLKNGCFSESPNALKEKTEYRAESNPAHVFLEDHVQLLDNVEMPSCNLYGGYSEWCKSHGYHPLSAVSFSKEVKRKFPSVTLSANARSYNGNRTRFWKGLALLPVTIHAPTIKIASVGQDEIDLG